MGAEPGALGRHMIHDRVGHQSRFPGQCLDVAPRADGRIHVGVVLHAETAITRRGVERQHVNAVDLRRQCPSDLPHPAESRRAELVGIADEPGVSLGPLREAGRTARGCHEHIEAVGNVGDVGRTVDLGEQSPSQAQLSTSPASTGSGGSVPVRVRL